ncbi:PREDICTED: uncharacterized protein LOC101295716 [Fragaria vesca subsp. vesca]|uniref:uncharacterized protein LOC101295716 n=1 Tax=Fragaria vesca subsp. vesca TaxID=101020 RepID=UPI0002C320EB|nr:PREDICTED: uncharacterized protein LOC101295716 [Fragaria vesca subsp. vesca]
MAAISNSLTSPHLSSGSSLKQSQQCLGLTNLSLNSNRAGKVQLSSSKRSFAVQASYSDGGRSNSGSIFISGFVLGGLIVGTLGCVYAPQISKTLAGADRKELMRKLPNFLYDEEKEVEKTRKILAEKIAQLNSAIDGVSGQLQTKEDPDEVHVNGDEVEAAI